MRMMYWRQAGWACWVGKNRGVLPSLGCLILATRSSLSLHTHCSLSIDVAARSLDVWDCFVQMLSVDTIDALLQAPRHICAGRLACPDGSCIPQGRCPYMHKRRDGMPLMYLSALNSATLLQRHSRL